MSAPSGSTQLAHRTRLALASPLLLLTAAATLGCDGAIETEQEATFHVPGQPVSTDLSPFQQTRDAGAVQPDQTTPSPPGSPCEMDETPFEGACYSAPGMKWLTFDVAAQVCASRAAQVASIASEATNQFIFGLLPMLNQQAWIGLRRQGGGFRWTDGAPVAYQRWAPGEPNNDDGAENCVVMWGPNLKSHPDWQGKWNDTACDTNVDTVICRRIP